MTSQLDQLSELVHTATRVAARERGIAVAADRVSRDALRDADTSTTVAVDLANALFRLDPEREPELREMGFCWGNLTQRFEYFIPCADTDDEEEPCSVPA